LLKKQNHSDLFGAFGCAGLLKQQSATTGLMFHSKTFSTTMKTFKSLMSAFVVVAALDK
jgi:hypothetical protein